MTVAAVQLWGTEIGAVSLGDDESVASFEYEPDFATAGIELSPLLMPVTPGRIYRFPGLAKTSFDGLPGLLADSLPDRYGNALIDAWLATQGRAPGSFNAVERLCYIGTRGMGALEFSPARGPRTRTAQKIEIDALVELASEVLTHRNSLQVSFGDSARADALRTILQV